MLLYWHFWSIASAVGPCTLPVLSPFFVFIPRRSLEVQLFILLTYCVQMDHFSRQVYDRKGSKGVSRCASTRVYILSSLQPRRAYFFL